MLGRLKTKCENLMVFVNTDLSIRAADKGEAARFLKLNTPTFLSRHIEAAVKRSSESRLFGPPGAADGERVHLYVDPFRMCYLTWPVADENTGAGEKRFFVTLGPFIMERLTADEIRYMGYGMKLGSDNCLVLESFFGILPFYERENLARLTSVLSEYLFAAPRRIQLMRYDASADPVKEAVPAGESFEALSFVEENYAAEAKVLRAVEHGDTAFLRTIFHANMPLFNLPPRYPSDPLREIKNLSITFNSLCTRAAIAGGLSPSIAHNLSHSTAVRIEQQTSAEAMRGLIVEIVERYAESVRKYALGQYSDLVLQTMNYIRRHTASPLSLKRIAEEQHVSKEHLCRRFAEETKLTVTDYIHKAKVQASCDLLASRKYGVGDIAFTFGYSSPSHYTKTFKKHMGMPPKSWQRLQSVPEAAR